MGLPLVAVTLAHRKGYFRQKLDEDGVQTEEPQPWNIEEKLSLQEPIITITIEGRDVAIRVWRYDLIGVTGHRIPVFFLDTDLP
jgi:starch phosphorylase